MVLGVGSFWDEGHIGWIFQREYKCLSPTRLMPATFSSSTEAQRQRNIIHALVRADVKGGCPYAAEQSIPSYSGVHAGLNMKQQCLFTHVLQSTALLEAHIRGAHASAGEVEAHARPG